MRAFVFLLILANLLFLAWTQGFLGSSSGPDALRLQQQLRTDNVVIVARDVPPELPVNNEKDGKAAEKGVVNLCTRLDELPLADATRFEAALAGKMPTFKVARTMTKGRASYLVYIPPQDSKQDADKKAGELKKLNIPDFFVVQDDGPNRFAISLGIFSSEAAANEQYAKLRKKGVRSAKVGERSAKPSAVSLDISGPEVQAEALRHLVAEVLPEKKPGVCKATVAAEQ